MKNSKLLFLALFISLTTSAQVKIGGGPDEDGEYPQHKMDADKGMDDLLSELKKNDLKCSKSPRLKDDYSIVQVYLKLSLLQNIEKSSELCAEANKYLACVNTRASAKIASKVLMTKESVPHLSKALSINEDETRKIFKYFAESEKKKK